MKIQWLGHASFLITTADGIKIITDPYQPGDKLCYGPINISPDIVTVSHEHYDHAYVKGLPNHFEIVSGTGSRTIRGINFIGIESFHDTQHGAARGANTIFVIEADDLRLCHLGDLGHTLSEEMVSKIGRPDVLMIPVGGTYTIDPKEAEIVASQLNPKIIIPMHFRSDKCKFPIASVDEFTAGKDNVRVMDGSELEITEAELPREQEVLILKHAL